MAGDSNHPVLVDVELHLTAAAAERAGGWHPIRQPGAIFETAQIFGQGPGGAGQKAFAAGFAAVGIDRHNPALIAGAQDVDGPDMLIVTAGGDAAVAENAALRPIPDQRGGVFRRVILGRGGHGNMIHTIVMDQILQGAFSALVTHGAVVMPSGDQQAEDLFAGRCDPLGIGSNVHVRIGRGGTGRNQDIAVEQFYNADSAGRRGSGPRQMTEGRDGDLVVFGHFKDCLPRREGNFPAVEQQR